MPDTKNPRLDTPAVRLAARKVFDYLPTNPGATFNELKARLGIAGATLRRARERLELHDAARIEHADGQLHFYAEPGNYVDLEVPDAKLMRALDMSLALLNAAGLNDLGDCVAEAMSQLQARAKKAKYDSPAHIHRLFATAPISTPCPNEPAIIELMRAIEKGDELTVVTADARSITFTPEQITVEPTAGWRVVGTGGISRTWAFDIADLEHVSGTRWRVA